MTEHKRDDKVMLLCFVLTYQNCKPVEWLYEGNNKDTETSQYPCSAAVTLTSHLNRELLKCKVTDSMYTVRVKKFSFTPQLPGAEKVRI